MNSVRDILDAIRALPHPDRLNLAEALSQELGAQNGAPSDLKPPPGSLLERREGFYVYTGRFVSGAFDHRVNREERIDELISRIDAHRG